MESLYIDWFLIQTWIYNMGSILKKNPRECAQAKIPTLPSSGTPEYLQKIMKIEIIENL